MIPLVWLTFFLVVDCFPCRSRWVFREISRDEADDIDRYGACVGYDSGGVGIVYGQYEDKNTDSGKNENDRLVLGYKYPLGPKAWFIAQYRRPEVGADDTALVVRVDF